MLKCSELSVARELMSHQPPLRVTLQGSDAIKTSIAGREWPLTATFTHKLATRKGRGTNRGYERRLLEIDIDNITFASIVNKPVDFNKLIGQI